MTAVDQDGFYLAGHLAPAGRYRRVEPPDGRIVEIDHADVLPGSLDGRVALYARVGTAQPASPPTPRTPRHHPIGTA